MKYYLAYISVEMSSDTIIIVRAKNRSQAKILVKAAQIKCGGGTNIRDLVETEVING